MAENDLPPVIEIPTSNLFQRGSLVVDRHCLVILEQRFVADRARRVYYDRVSSLAIWRTVPWLRMLAVLLILALPGVLILAANRSNRMDSPGVVIGLILLGLALLLLLRYAWYGVMHLRLKRDSATHQFHFVIRPGKARRMERMLNENIRADQQSVRSSEPASPEDGVESPVLPGRENW